MLSNKDDNTICILLQYITETDTLAAKSYLRLDICTFKVSYISVALKLVALIFRLYLSSGSDIAIALYRHFLTLSYEFDQIDNFNWPGNICSS